MEHLFFLLTLSLLQCGNPNLVFHTQGAAVSFFLFLLLPRTEFVIEVQKKYCGLVESRIARQLSDIKKNKKKNISAASLFKAFAK